MGGCSNGGGGEAMPMAQAMVWHHVERPNCDRVAQLGARGLQMASPMQPSWAGQGVKSIGRKTLTKL